MAAIRMWHCEVCDEEFRSKNPMHCDQEATEVLVPPSTKMMEKASATSNRSKMVDQAKILKARARAHARETQLDDLIQTNNEGVARQSGWLNEKGEKRKKIDEK